MGQPQNDPSAVLRMARTDFVVVTRRNHPDAVLVHLDDEKILDRSRRRQPADFAGGGRRPRTGFTLRAAPCLGGTDWRGALGVGRAPSPAVEGVRRLAPRCTGAGTPRS
ncbi:type II toxin-antitoxin system prevent-host-death family antitoxin [Zeimonas sediminis]|uniref:type II toxin-antitoxin system prevent-host-death family antitoxin n=1 Tax=Zeimonas sediminis TaxID=2944268 RepID=UPI003AEFF4CC